MKKSSLPKNAKVIPVTWAFKTERFTSGEFRSFKARFCVRGDLQKKAVSDLDTYSPVAQWSSVTNVNPVYSFEPQEQVHRL